MGRKQKIISIELGSSTIRICEMDQSEKPRIYHFLELDTPEQAVSDGYISPDRFDEVKKVIVDALKHNKIKTKKAIFTLFSSKIITREVMLPEMKEKQLKQVIEENINDYFPIELEDFRVTHTVIDAVKENDESVKCKVLIIAAEKKLVSLYEKLADMCRLTLIDVDYVGNSVFQALKKEPRFEAEMYVKVEAENTLILILEDDRLVLQRSLNYGIGYGKRDEDEMSEAIRPILGTISRVMHFYSGQSYNHLDKVTIIGSGAEYIKTFSELGAETGITYKNHKLSEDIIHAKNEELIEKVSDYIATIGAGISPVKLINYKSSIKRVNYIRASILMILLYVVVNCSLMLMVHLPYLDAEEKNKDLKKLEIKYSEAEEIYNKNVQLEAFYTKFVEGDSYTKHANDGLLDFIKELEKKLPNDVTVYAMNSNDENVIMQIEVSSKEEAAGVINELRNMDTVMEVNVVSVAETKDEESEDNEGSQKVNFTITCTYYPLHNEEDYVNNEE